ncbi:nicotinate-nucleotide--dimethylbenzimidazole phosphoribosyltransferase [Clostridium botulinum]|uniref:nicotinate-nucleotide--dimethylbenzimidazole phosphoribosyltransferase n=1 Tax=Clostridium botulinum TaxID=1491 RepID=UPI00052C1BEA|nr:nicotinate-nucleotide--dimethylbenzimidazole phosphoribosyltransferase [Clostridium botulinum]KGM95237.1 nicotinate-nucleotide--dimethylbenzimidazole phosphoribosyltransferase [Clostridium botulinum D str. CCUG 7971]KOC46096.1 nicotinate-nucleotide--dimethylbenzimidazole phosphoribosyltransferase [Clostridium botulinum]NFO98063.1 nicotinate-nucleotide--dimethylbenzimidazole phosphoribosyltransferase [Clostridium botulinum]OOV52610.1 nicotinate-nucleotide--dimethylbenzimidazole phosphoribosyl
MNLLNDVLEGIKPLDYSAMNEALKRLDKLAKPLGSLGRLEDIAMQISGITGNVKNKCNKKCTIVMAADNGIWEEGVSACPQSITAIQTINMLKGLTGVAVISKHANADIRVIDIGINAEISHPDLINRKIRMGTYNILKGSAMIRSEAIKAIEIGIETVRDLMKEEYSVLGTGEMGICNTSTSSAILMSLTGCSADIAVGKGSGITEEAYNNKKNIIEKAININKPNREDPIDVLSKVGGFDIAGLVGCFLGAAYYRVPIVIDGFISSAAALIAYKLNPLTKEYMIPSHASKEPGFNLIMKELELEPLFNLNMRLGEGSGCPLTFDLIDAASDIMCNMATFKEASIIDDYLIDIR